MSMQHRPSSERGHADHGWLRSQHSFSFANYYDPEHMGFSALRVINEDRVQGGAGFAAHSHRDMEILSYVLEGAIEHRDSMGNGSVITAGEMQRMSAGTGVTHSEFNHDAHSELRFLQIWIVPDRKGHTPGYEQKRIDVEATRGALHLAASPDGRDGSLSIHQDAFVYVARLDAGEALSTELDRKRRVWLQLISGELALADATLVAGDGVGLAGEERLALTANADAHFLVFDLP